MISFDLSGKHAIVTGAGQGLGKAIALRLAEAGACVHFADINGDKAAEACNEGRARGYACIAEKALDVSDNVAMQRMIQDVADTVGLDIMVNAAGIMYPASIVDVEPEKLKRIEEVNINGTVYGTSYAMQAMIANHGGRIVNISSISGRHGTTTKPFYSLSKAAVINYTQSAALYGAKYGVCVNAVCPGIVRTPMWEQILDFMVKDTGRTREQCWIDSLGYTIPMGFEQEEIDVANAVLFLCSDFARYITAQSLNVDGGARMN